MPSRQPDNLVSLKILAEKCGVSVSTVSRALSVPPRGRISPKVREQIRRCAESCGYRGNPVARSLRIRRHETISLVLPPFFTQTPRSLDFDSHVRLTQWEVIFSVIRKAREHGYDVKLEPVQDENVSFLAGKLDFAHTDGAVFLTPEFFGPLFPALSAARFPYVTMNFTSSATPAMFYPNPETGYRQAVDFLLKSRRRRIGLLFEPERMHSEAILNVLRKVLRERGFCREDNFFHVWDVFSIRKLVDDKFYESLDAVFCSNDTMANMLEREFEYRRIPNRPAVIGYDNNPVYNTCSTIAVPRAEMARRTVELLIGHLTGKCRIGEASDTRVPTWFIHRKKVPENSSERNHSSKSTKNTIITETQK